MRRAFASVFAMSCLAFAVSHAEGASVLTSDQELVPTGKGWGEHQLNAPTAKRVPGAPPNSR